MKAFAFIFLLFTYIFVFAGDYNLNYSVLDWSEEFEIDGSPASNNWGYEVGYIRNNELQYYTQNDTKNARVEGGMLVIEAIKDANSKITSASINTLGKKNFGYGRIEVRAKVPAGKGTWPAIWLMGINRPQVSWPRCGEIDVMEYVGFDANRFHSNVHTLGSKQTEVGAMVTGYKATLSNATSQFHIFAVERSPSSIKFFVDEKLVGTYNKNTTYPDHWYGLDKNFYLLLNLAIGGSWGGQQGVDETIFPAKYYVDYVRYYTSPNDPQITSSNHKFVSPNGSDNNDGNSWKTSYASLKKAIDSCEVSDSQAKIWIAEGVYEQSQTLSLPKYFTITGGFLGYETEILSRKGSAENTIISGKDACRLFLNKNPDSSGRLEFVTLSNGTADSGGAVYNDAKATPEFYKCIFKKNYATSYGGAVFNNNSSPKFYHCTFSENSSDIGGGAFYDNYFSNSTLYRCRFEHNFAPKGGGLFVSHQSNSNVYATVFDNNTATSFNGGGIFATGGCAANFESCAIFSNKAPDGSGGAIYATNSPIQFINCVIIRNSSKIASVLKAENNSPIKLINCTISENSATQSSQSIVANASNPIIFNSIIWGNGIQTYEILEENSASVKISNSIVEGGWDKGTNILTSNPLLKNFANNGGYIWTIAVDPASPARNAGTSVFESINAPELDACNFKRSTLNCTIGSYEFLDFSSFDNWQSQSWRNGTKPSQSLLLPDASVFDDGITNLQKYSFGIPPTKRASASDFNFTIKKTENSAEFYYEKNFKATDVDFEILWSTDLVNWRNDSLLIEEVSKQIDTATYKAVLPNFQDSTSSVFFKINLLKK